jgi:hypothetical protein
MMVELAPKLRQWVANVWGGYAIFLGSNKVMGFYCKKNLAMAKFYLEICSQKLFLTPTPSFIF